MRKKTVFSGAEDDTHAGGDLEQPVSGNPDGKVPVPREEDTDAFPAEAGAAGLQILIDRAVEEYLDKAPPPGDTASIEPSVLNRVIGRLDELFWRKAMDTLESRLEQTEFESLEIPFTDEDRLLLDFGFLDGALIRDTSPEEMKERLLAERAQDAGEEFNVIYFTDWLHDRLRYLLTIEEVGTGEDALRQVEAVPEMRSLTERRDRLLASIRPFLRRLPGVPEVLCRLVAEGRLDDLMLRLFLERRLKPGKDKDRRLMRLESAYRFVLHRVAERVPEESYLALLDEYNDLRLKIFRKVNRLPAGGLEPSVRRMDEGRVKRQLMVELKLVRSLLNLGTVTSAISRPHSVLLRDIERSTPLKVAEVLSLIRSADPTLALQRTVLIAPFTGNGFFEWDRDTIMVSLIPVRSVEENVATAVAGLRMSLDRFQHDEELRRSYRELNPEGDFKESFTRDYLSWVLRVGRGQKQQISQDSFEFFMRYIGHNGVDPVPLAELTGLTVAQKDSLYQQILTRVREKRATPDDLLIAGVIRWQRGDHSGATRYMERAARLDPSDPRISYSLGILLRNTRQRGAARNYLLQCTRSAPQSIWKVYAFEALKRLPG